MRKIILLLLFSASQIFCQNYIWEKYPTPTDGQLLTHHFSNDGSIYISIYGHGLLKSKDNGLTWAKVNDGLGNQLNIISIVEKSDGILFALGDSYANKLYQSTDKGSSWEIIAEFVSGSDRFTQVAVSDSAVYLVYQGYGGAICRAKFSDKKWKYVFTNNSYLERMFITSQGTIYTIDGDGKLFKSNDGGDSFTQNQSKMPYAENSNGYLFTYSRSDGYYRSPNDGISWQKINTNLPDEVINNPNLAIDRENNLYIIKHIPYSQLEEDVYLSNDNGITWTKSFKIPQTNLIVSSSEAVGISFSISNEMYLVNSIGLNKYNQSNMSLISISQTKLDDLNRQITSLFFKDGKLFVAGNCNASKSDIQGANKVYEYINDKWETRNCLYPGQIVKKIMDVPKVGILYGFTAIEGAEQYGSEGGCNLLGAKDLGLWFLSSNGYYKGNSVNTFEYFNSEIYYGTSKGIFRWDAGNYSIEVNDGLTNKDVLSMTTTASSLFCGTNGGGVYRYQKNSESNAWAWKQINNGLTEYWITSLATTSNGYLYAGADFNGGVFYSTDNGDTWKRSNANTIFKSGSISSMIVAKDRIFAIRNLSDVYLSTDFAQTWGKITDTLSNNYPITALAYDDLNDYLYIGTSYYGIKRVLINTQTSVTDNNTNIPTEFILEQNYPNPFNPSTTISFSLPKSTSILLRLYNSLGQELQTISSGYFNAGKHTIQFSANNLSSGVYLYKLIADNISTTKKLMIIK